MITGVTDFGQQIQIELVKQKKTKSWLIKELQEKTGKYVDRSNLHKIMTGKIKSSALTEAIKDILCIDCEEEVRSGTN